MLPNNGPIYKFVPSSAHNIEPFIDTISNKHNKPDDSKITTEGQSKTVDTTNADHSLILANRKCNAKFKITEEDILMANQPQLLKQNEKTKINNEPQEHHRFIARNKSEMAINKIVETPKKQALAEEIKDDSDHQNIFKGYISAANIDLNQNVKTKDKSTRITPKSTPKSLPLKTDAYENIPESKYFSHTKITDRSLLYLLELEKIKQDSIIKVTQSFCNSCFGLVKSQIIKRVLIVT